MVGTTFRVTEQLSRLSRDEEELIVLLLWTLCSSCQLLEFEGRSKLARGTRQSVLSQRLLVLDLIFRFHTPRLL